MKAYPKLSSIHQREEPRAFLKAVLKLDKLDFSDLLSGRFPADSLARVYFLSCLNSDESKFRSETLQELLDKYYPNTDLDTISDNLATAILRFLKERY